MQHAADFRKFTIRVENKIYQFDDEESTRTTDRALTPA